jgi:tetratricopeptide (TPR) repeat protein
MDINDRLTQLVQKNEESTGEDWFILGNQFYEIGDHEKAIYCFDRCIEKVPDSYMTAANIGVMHSNMNHKEEAIKYLNKAIEINPEYGNGWYNLGYAYSLMGDKENMLKSYKKAITAEEEVAATLYCTIGYALLISCKNNGLEAKKALIQGIWLRKMEREGDDIKMELLNLGHIYLSEGNERLAVDKYQSSLYEGGSIGVFKSIYTPDINDLIQLGVPESEIYEVLTKIENTEVGTPRLLSQSEFVDFVKSDLVQLCKNITFRHEPDGIYLLFFDEIVIRWRFEHAYERYLGYKIEWELVALGLAKNYNENIINHDNCILQIIGADAIQNYSINKIAYHQLNEYLFIYFAEDRVDRIKQLNESKYFEKGFINWNRDYESALNQLIHITFNNGVSFLDEILCKKIVIDNFASALILVDWFWDNLPFHDPDKQLIIGIPDRDSLYFIDEGDKLISFQFETFIMNQYVENQFKVSPYLFIRKDGKFERYETFPNRTNVKSQETKKWWHWWKK